MSSDSSAKRYAVALFEMARDANRDSSIYQNACDFSGVLERSSDLKIALSHPNIQKADRKKIMSEVLASSGYDHLFCNFLKVLADRSKIALFPKILAEYEALRDKASGRIRAQVYVAQNISAAQKQTLKTKIEGQLGHEVVLQERIEPSIIGGFRLEINGRVYDNSIRRHLERLSEEMHVEK